jgi:hypothetical protein
MLFVSVVVGHMTIPYCGVLSLQNFLGWNHPPSLGVPSLLGFVDLDDDVDGQCMYGGVISVNLLFN